MFDHISIGVKNLDTTQRFYDAVLGSLGIERSHRDDTSLGYAKKGRSFWAYRSERPVPADRASGLHFCFTADTREAVDAFHRWALELGGSDNGGPGIRADYGASYYAAFVLDPDGYRIEAYCGK